MGGNIECLNHFSNSVQLHSYPRRKNNINIICCYRSFGLGLVEFLGIKNKNMRSEPRGGGLPSLPYMGSVE
jgi:hypothetical protein